MGNVYHENFNNDPMQIDMWVARIWEYLLAAGIYWWVALAVLLMLERLAERTFHGFWGKWVDPWFTPDRRKQVLVFFALVAFVIANFRAFDVEREAKDHAIDERQKVPLDPMILYQDGFQVASIIDPRIDALANTMVFPVITASRN